MNMIEATDTSNKTFLLGLDEALELLMSLGRNIILAPSKRADFFVYISLPARDQARLGLLLYIFAQWRGICLQRV
jgi:hypothetical protein